jgi:hypothetical protein
MDPAAADADAGHDNEFMNRSLLAFAVLLLGATTAYGDGGAMLLHQDSGPFTITLFASPQPLHTGMAEISVMVQDRFSSQVLTDPTIEVTLNQESAMRLAPGKAGNRLMQSAEMQLSRAGRSKLEVVVRRGNDVARLTTAFNVDADRSRVALVWIYILLPAVAVALFAIQQRLKMRKRTPGLW